MARLFHIPQAVRIDSTGTPYPSAEANMYLTGTTTPTDTYTDNALTTTHANPVVADAGGQFPAIYLDPAVTYRCVITQQSGGATIDDIDPVHAPFAAVDVAVTDAGSYFAGANVEAVLQDIGANYPKNATTETISAAWTFSAQVNFGDNVLSRPVFTDFGVTHNSVSSSSNVVTLDLTTGNSFATTLTENITTVTLSNPPASGTFGQLTWFITQDGGGGAYTVTFPGSVSWPGGTAPTISTANDAVDIVTLMTNDGGTTWRGNFSQAYA